MKILLTIMLIILLIGCAAQESFHIKNGRQYGVTEGPFRDRWWNYYERGLSFAEGEFFVEAIDDLQYAIKKREKDRWRSRTYGMHFVNYFPHRELGIIFFRLNRNEEAKKELEYSLNTAESSKAKYYLNKVRKAIIKNSGADTLKPVFKIFSPVDGTVTNRMSLVINAIVEDDSFIEFISIINVPLLLELSSQKVLINEEVQLKQGNNEIKIEAVDLTGKTSEKRINVTVDREGPIIAIEDQEISDGRFIVSGFLSDSSSIQSFLINGQIVHLIPDNIKSMNTSDTELLHEFKFQHEIKLTGSADTINFQASDVAGNLTTGKLNINEESSSSGLQNLPLLASASTDKSGSLHVWYSFLGSGLGKLIDDSPPIIFLKDLMDSQTVFDNSIFIEGSVSDYSKIQSLFINKEPVIKRAGKKIFFNHLVQLDEGDNRFVIEAVDTFGNKELKEFRVIRKVPQIRKMDSRMSISVVPLDRRGKKNVSGDAINDSLISAFVNQKRFNMVERERISEVLKELKLSQTDLVDPQSASRVGKIVTADAILTGTVYESENAIEILTRLIDTESSEIIEAEDVYDEDKSLPAIMNLMQGLAVKYKQNFPLLEGLVIKRDGKSVLTDLGSENRLNKYMGLILFRDGEEISHPVTGKILGSEPVLLGEADVESVYDQYSKAVIRTGEPREIKAKDRIITK